MNLVFILFLNLINHVSFLKRKKSGAIITREQRMTIEIKISIGEPNIDICRENNSDNAKLKQYRICQSMVYLYISPLLPKRWCIVAGKMITEVIAAARRTIE